MIYLISLILLLLPTYLIRFSIFNIPTTFLEILIYIIFIYGLFRARKTGFRAISLKIILPIVLLIIALTISTVVSPDKRAALGEFKGFFIDPILVFWLIFQFVKEKDLPKVFWSLIFSGTFVAVHTIIQKLLGNTTSDGRVIGIFGYSPNFVALFLAPITVLVAAYGFQFMIQKRWFLSISAWLLVILNFIAIYFSGSRGGILAIAAGLGIYVILNFWSWIKTRLSAQIMIGILIIMAIYTSWILFRPDFTVTQTSGGRVATSNNLRWQIWETSLEMIKNHPILGVGLGNFQNAFSELTKNRGNFPEYITPQAATPHNIFLMFYLATGILGLVAFLWLLVLFFREGLKKLNSKSVVIMLAVLFSIIAYGLIESSIWKNDLSIIFWTMGGLIWII
ncbi:MAG: O-antigen ligase family protein [Patescibacteria group bacterium]|nr:O-antigen ligase family protein [Patescibacteria group bacterium]